MQLVAVKDQCQVRHLKNKFTHLVIQSTLLEIWLQLFYDNYQNRIAIYKINMSELFQTIPKSIPPKRGDGYKEKKHTTIKEVCDDLFANKLNSNPPA